MQSDAPRPVPGSGPLRVDERYRPHRDPQVILLVLIVVGTFAVMFGGLGTGPPFGGGGNNTDGPVFPFYDYDGSQQPRPDQVRLSADRTVVDPGGAIEFVVRAGDRPVANATLQVAGQSVETDRNGTATVRFDAPGEYTARIVEPGDENDTVARLPVRVRRFTVSLSASASATTVETGEPIRVTVTRADTGERVTGRVVVDGRTVRTNESGVATLSFDTAGGYELSVEKERTDTERFELVRIPVSVERRPVDLNVTLASNRTKVEEPATVTVRRADTGAPVNASVAVGDRRVWTGSDGTTTVVLNESGTYAVTASAPRTPAVRFVDATASMEVRPRLVGLDLAVDGTRVPAGERVTFTLTRATTGEPVAGTVELFGTRYLTGDDGRLRVTFQVPGNVSAVGRAPETPRERFLPTRTNLTVVGADYAVTDLDAPATAARNGSVSVGATVTNEGNDRASETVTYRIGDTVLATETVDLEPGESTRVEFDVAVPDLPPGEYVQTVAVGRDAADTSLTVTDNESAVVGPFGSSRRSLPASN